MIDIFNKRWHGIKGETIGEGKYKTGVVRIQTTDQGPWQALNEKELQQLLTEHNKIIHKSEKVEVVKKIAPGKKKKAKKK